MAAHQKNPSPSASEPTRLSRDHWLDEAFQAVVLGGFDHVKVLSIAEKLKVTRGSFYWHFADHADLIGSLLMRWKLSQLALDARLKSHQTGDPIKDLEFVVDAAFTQAGSDLENLRFEQAMRALSHQNQEAAQMLVEVDAERLDLALEFRLIDFFENIFEATVIGFEDRVLRREIDRIFAQNAVIE